MRAALTTVCLVGLGACATTDAAEPAPVVATDTVRTSDPRALPPKTLAPGECGLFGYSTDAPPRFVFFAVADRALYHAGERGVLALSPQGAYPAETYGPVSLTLGPAEDLVEGRRYARSRLTEQLEDGYEWVRPLVVLETCGSTG
ncbi:MAG: hypothetical protein WBF53_04345 [Litorimonas sp.]